MISKCFVYITLPGQTRQMTAGKFVLDPESGTGKFVYGASYLNHPDAVEIDPIQFKWTDKPYKTDIMGGMFGSIRDAGPDHWGRRVIEKHIGKIGLSEMDYVLKSPEDRIGALGFGLNPVPPAPSYAFNKMVELEKLQHIAECILKEDAEEIAKQNQSELAQTEELLLVGTSMGGARPKAVVSDNNELWLAKFNTDADKWNNTLVEHAMLTLAKEVGIRAASSKGVRVGGKDVILIKRFDREWTASGYLKHRMFSALTALKSDDNPVARKNWSYIRLAEEIRKFAPSAKEDCRELFKRMVFNGLISNTDDHPRNHAFIAKNDWKLSPAYDLTPTPMFAQEQRFSALDCGKGGRWFNAKNMLSKAPVFLLAPAEAKSIIETMSNQVGSGWYKIAKSAGVSDKDCETIRSAFVYSGFWTGWDE
jgi:serine/threonine-protein kinase HipA